ncbi:MAG TPA: IS1595 family transposase [Tepidisphaeraceae bacterium]|jgi:transposase-like protein
MRQTTDGPNKAQRGQAVPHFTEDKAREYFEKLRWPNGPSCVHCGSVGVYKLQGNATRPGLLKCQDCKGQFTVTVDTVMEDTHLPLSLWAKAFHMMAFSKKGISALQMKRQLGIGSYRTAWHLCRRIRYAMEQDIKPGMLKGQVQVDETWVGGKIQVGRGENRASHLENKTAVVALVETDGKVRSKPIEHVDGKTLRAALDEVCHPSAQIVTDDHTAYPLATANFEGGHQTVNHSKEEYARKQKNTKGEIETITTNTAESYFSLLKRGVYGSFHFVSKKHLHRYCSEFDFRWNGIELMDTERRDAAVRGGEGKRLFYKMPVGMA